MKTRISKKKTYTILFLMTMLFTSITPSSAAEISIKVEKQYLNFPVAQQTERSKITFATDQGSTWSVVVRLAAGQPDYWVFYDVTHLKGQTLKITYEGESGGLSQIYQSDQIHGQENLYKEANRPQFHFTTRRGWINDPNGLIFHDGEYHLFYQHNPMEREWENMHWGHAISSDLIHWEELPTALYPDELGTMFSGSAVMDYDNTAGFNREDTVAMIAFYTVANPDRQIQCMAYSLDKGRSWTKYGNNPLIDSKEKWKSVDTRDPKVFWYSPSGHWVMVLNERDGHSIYTSHNLKDWQYQSHVTGFWECPELFELPIDGDENNKKWVMYGATGTYMIGSFDGQIFTPEAGKYYYCSGAQYAAQTFNNIPQTDGRRIQIGWGRIPQGEGAFNGMMMLPTELSLCTTKEGTRLISKPVKEVEQLFAKNGSWKNLTAEQANKYLEQYQDTDRIRIKARIKLSHATDAGLALNGQRIVNYDMNGNMLNGMFFSPEDRTSMTLSADIFIDRTSVEIFFDDGIYTSYQERKANTNDKRGFHFFGNRIQVEELEIYEVRSIWTP